MKEQTIDEVEPLLFQDHLVLALDKEWVRIFNGIPAFDVLFDQRQRLVIRSQSSCQLKNPIKNCKNNSDLEEEQVTSD